ncbi:DUF4177 domain-containing protein [Chachezhania antarctica]|uniref:DUF4177 domain-containing protein n=1 Tax=Chachezhania antarctica TaxID=2340860 RepID=UPI000EAC01A2|nr:DUF4177 domain-containing protein [Chachezhania antarctica]|tara:strand:+ start:1809 stop:2270 length:462 start_codon:yes stop_codon:yes gene_type:complete
MQRYEYKVIPAPTKAQKARGVKTPEGRFAATVESELNRMGADGWEFQRAETLPAEERSGLTGSTRAWRTMLVFRRATGAATVQDAELATDVKDTASVKDTPSLGSAVPREPSLGAADRKASFRPLAPETWPDGTPMTSTQGRDDDADDEDRRS